MTPLPSTGQITTVSSLANGITLDRASCPSGNVAKLQYILRPEIQFVGMHMSWNLLLPLNFVINCLFSTFGTRKGFKVIQASLEVDVDLVTVPEIEAWQYLLQDFIWKARPSRRFPNVQRNNQQ